MRSLIAKDRNLAALSLTFSLFLLFLIAYYLPRSAKLNSTLQQNATLSQTRQEVALLLPQLALTSPTAPPPSGKVSAFISTDALPGLDPTKQVAANDSYLDGKGAKVKLRRLTPEQAAQFLAKLTKVRLIVERMQLQDSDGDGLWDIDIDLKVPEVT